MPFALAPTAVHGSLIALALAAALAVSTAAVFLAFFHRRFHVFSLAARLAILHLTLVLAATGRRVFGVRRSMMATSFVVFSIGRVVMTAPLSLRSL